MQIGSKQVRFERDQSSLKGKNIRVTDYFFYFTMFVFQILIEGKMHMQ